MDSRTSIESLLEYCLRRRTKVLTPTGLTRFLQTCNILHVTPSIFTSPAKEYYLAIYNDQSKIVSTSELTPQRINETVHNPPGTLKGYEALNIEDEFSSASRNVSQNTAQEEF